MLQINKKGIIIACLFCFYLNGLTACAKETQEVEQEIITMNQNGDDISVEDETKILIEEQYIYTTQKTYIYNLDMSIFCIVEQNTKLYQIQIQETLNNEYYIIQIENQNYYIAAAVTSDLSPELLAEDIFDQIQQYNEDIRYLSAIIYAEARDQCIAGQQAVGIIVMNRVESDQFANSIYDVIYQKGQFTPTINGSLTKALSLYDSENFLDECINAAIYSLYGNKTVEYNNTIYDLTDYFFFSRYISNAKLIIQDHMFK